MLLLICSGVSGAEDSFEQLLLRGDYDGLLKRVVHSEEDADYRFETLLNLGRFDTLDTEAPRLLKLLPEAFFAAEHYAAAFMARGNFGKVRELHEQGYGDISFLNLMKRTGDPGLQKACADVLRKHSPDTPTIYSVMCRALALRFLDKHQRAMNELTSFKTDSDIGKIRVFCATGDLFLEKYNTQAAVAEFSSAYKISKEYIPTLEGVMAAAYSSGDLTKCEALADVLTRLNPKHYLSLLIRAKIRLMEHDHDSVRKIADILLSINPLDPAALAVSAASYKLQRKEEEYNAELKKGRESGYALSEFQLPLASMFIQQKKGDLALELLGPLLQEESENASVLSGIAWILLRKGQLEDAKEMFERAHSVDDFNHMVYNVLHLLDKLELYEKKQTEHFNIVFDPSVDAVSADYFAEHVEDMYTKLSRQYGYDVEGKIHLFLFPKHSYLAVMTIGLPNLGMPALCVGNSIYCDTPNVLKTHLSMNWYKVIRHEIVHVFNLLQTDFNVPHWFTEGLAVLSEELEKKYDWDRTLLRAMILDKLHPFDEMNLGFYRPEDSLSRFQAYAEAYFAILFIVKNYGMDKLNDFINEFAKGLTFKEAVPVVLGISQDELQKGLDAYYREYLGRLTISPRFIPEDAKQLQTMLASGNVDAGAWFVVETGSQELIDRMKDLGGGRAGLTDRLTVAQALFYYKKGNAVKALDLLKKVEFEKGFAYYRLKGQCLREIGKEKKKQAGANPEFVIAPETADARDAMIKAWEIYRFAPDIMYDIALLERELGRKAQYRKWMERYLKAADDQVDKYVEYALFLVEEKDSSRAVLLLERAKKANPSDPEMRVILGKAYLMERKFDNALSEYEKAYTIKPKDAKIKADYERVKKFVQKAKNADFK